MREMNPPFQGEGKYSMYLPRSIDSASECTKRSLADVPWRKYANFLLLIGLILFSPSSIFAATITFQTEPGRPRIASSTPSRNMASFPVNGEIIINFDQDMDPSSLNTQNIRLVDLSTGQVPTLWNAVSVTNATTSFRARLNSNLDTNRTYALVLTTNVRSAAGRSLDPSDPHHRSGTLYGEAWLIEFSTGTFAPAAIKNTNIGNIMGGATGGQTGVPVNAVIRVNFERAMDPNTINSNNIVLRKSGGDANVPLNITYDDVSLTAVITPARPLDYGTSYTLTLLGLQDSLGNPLP